MTTPIVELCHVSKSYEDRGALPWGLFGNLLRDSAFAPRDLPAVQDVSLAISPAEIVALVGESGAGKSTLARLVLGLERPDSGQVCFNKHALGQQSKRALRRVRQQMHLIFQDPYQSLHPGMRVAQLVGAPLAIAGTPKTTRANAVAEALGIVGLELPADFLSRFPHQLSGGQRQRVALARALVARPKLVIADEPTSMLDTVLRKTILALIDRLRTDFQIAFLFITHDLHLAQQIADRIAVMRGGRLVEIGPTEAVINQPQHEYTRLLWRASERFLVK